VAPELELIALYHNLYQPYPNRWDENLELEKKVFTLMKNNMNLISGGKNKHTKRKHKNENKIENKDLPHEIKSHEDITKIRNFLYDTNVEIGILIGSWAIVELYGGKRPYRSKLQYLPDIHVSDGNDNFTTTLKNISDMLRDITKHKVYYRIDDISVAGDYWLKRATFYINKFPLLDVFNSLEYEIVPYLITNDRIIGNPYVLCRFFMINLWSVITLFIKKIINRQTLDNVQISIINNLEKLRLDKDNVFGLQYKGIMKNLVNEKKKMIIKEQATNSFYPYSPLSYFEERGHLREIKSAD
jgi:hypothetical protein